MPIDLIFFNGFICRKMSGDDLISAACGNACDSIKRLLDAGVAVNFTDWVSLRITCIGTIIFMLLYFYDTQNYLTVRFCIIYVPVLLEGKLHTKIFEILHEK